MIVTVVDTIQHPLLSHFASPRCRLEGAPHAAAAELSPVLKDNAHYSVSVVVGAFPVIVASKVTEQSAAYVMIVTILASPTVPLAYSVSLPLPLLE
eukprot:scaffold220637_cov35-Attheya_sp.AAC.1